MSTKIISYHFYYVNLTKYSKNQRTEKVQLKLYGEYSTTTVQYASKKAILKGWMKGLYQVKVSRKFKEHDIKIKTKSNQTCLST